MVATFGFGFSFWLHQGGIPHRMCRFYLLLAGAVGKRQGIAIPYPSPTPLLTPWGIRCGGALLLPRAYRDFGFRYPVLLLLPSSEYCLAICVRLCIVRVSVGVLGFGRTFFIIGGVGRSFLRIRGVLLWSIVGITADREWNVNMADEGEENRILSFHPQYGIICTVSHHCTGNYIPHSLPVEGG